MHFSSGTFLVFNDSEIVSLIDLLAVKRLRTPVLPTYPI